MVVNIAFALPPENISIWFICKSTGGGPDEMDDNLETTMSIWN